MTKRAEEEHQERYRRMMEAVRSDKTGFLGIVIGGAYVEYYVRSSIERSLPEPDRYFRTSDGKDIHRDFMDMLKLTYALENIDDETYALFKRFAELRNQFAHGVDETLYKSEQRQRFRRLLAVWKAESGNQDSQKQALENFNTLSDEQLFEVFTYLVGVVASYAFGAHANVQALFHGAIFKAAVEEAAEAGRRDREAAEG